MQGKAFSLSGDNLTLGTGTVLWAIRTAADALTAGGMLELLRLEVFQRATLTAAMCAMEIATRNTSGTLTMTSQAPRPINPVTGPASAIQGSTAPAGTAARSGINSSADSGGTYASEKPFTFHNLNGYLWVPTPEERIIVPPGVVVACRFLSSPGSTSGWGFNLTFRELA